MSPVVSRELEHWPISQLQPYSRNARTHSREQVRQIAASIQEFGFTNPILVAEDGEIIAGHGRLMAAHDLGLTEVPVIVLGHLTAEQRRAYVLADNQLALNAGWDTSLLQQEVMALNLADFDLNLLGFDADELSSLMGGEFDSAEEESEEPEDEGPDRGVALAIVLSPEELKTWRRAKEELGYSTDKSAFWKLVEDLLEEVDQ